VDAMFKGTLKSSLEAKARTTSSYIVQTDYGPAGERYSPLLTYKREKETER